MSLTSRRLLLSARWVAVLSAVVLRGRGRAAAWTLHEVLRFGPVLARNTAWLGPVVRRFQPEGREVWLTIDDGPEPSQTAAILSLLKTVRAKASFFAIGKKVEWSREACRRIVAEGHSIENHTHTHPAGMFWAAPSCVVRAEIIRCNHAIRVATGASPRWFRAPVGMINEHVHPVAAGAWLRVAGWSAAGADGVPGSSPRQIVSRIMRDVSPGAVIVIHEGAGRPTVQVLEHLLQELDTAGYRCVIPGPARGVV